jgi:hypothetical protein
MHVEQYLKQDIAGKCASDAAAADNVNNDSDAGGQIVCACGEAPEAVQLSHSQENRECRVFCAYADR